MYLLLSEDAYVIKLSLLCDRFAFALFLSYDGGEIVIKEVNSHWSDNLIPSPSKKDIIFQHVKGTGLHSYVEQPNGVKKYVCSPQAQCRSHQRHFMKNTTTPLYKHFLQMYPLRRGKFCAGICVAAHSGVSFTLCNVV